MNVLKKEFFDKETPRQGVLNKAPWRGVFYCFNFNLYSDGRHCIVFLNALIKAD